jgi:hypothetical protein
MSEFGGFVFPLEPLVIQRGHLEPLVAGEVGETQG